MKKAVIFIAVILLAVRLSAQERIDFKIGGDKKVFETDYFTIHKQDGNIFYYKHDDIFKFSIKPQLNDGIIRGLINGDKQYGKINTLHMRLKFYLTKNISLYFGSEFNGRTNGNYISSLVIKI